MFDWAHVLHRQIYDIYSDERLSDAARISLAERVTDYYLSRREYAFTTAPKSMALMDDQAFSQGFRKTHPKFNGLIWAYHWLQVGLYEPLLEGTTPAEKKAGVKATLARFWSMLEDPPAGFPQVMPMTAAVAPGFSARHPRAAIIFDNLHMMHDIISDILIAPSIPAGDKAGAIREQLAEFRDSTRNVMSLEEWRNMGEMMGLAAMGGPATGRLPPPATGAARPMDHAAMGHGTPSAPARSHQAPAGGAVGRASPELAELLMNLYQAILGDPLLRERVRTDARLHDLLRSLLPWLPAEHRSHLEGMLPARSGGSRPGSPPAGPRHDG